MRRSAGAWSGKSSEVPRIPEFGQIVGHAFRTRNRSTHKKRVQTEACTRKCRCPKAYLCIKPPRSSMASQKALAKRGSLAAMRALVAIQPDGVPVS